MDLKINNTFLNLPADPIEGNGRRQVSQACYSFVTPKNTSNPKMIHTSKLTGELLGLVEQDFESKEFLEVFTGNQIYKNTKPYAMCYGGHQFGNWAGQLGDGRATNLFEVQHRNKNWAVQLKGAGETPYSRTADGLAVLRSSIREYLCSEAMYHLGVPTTRALSLATTGDMVWRDVMYNGNPKMEKGAIVCRVAPSFIRFGSFEILVAKGDLATLQQLLDYTIKSFYPELSCTKEGYLSFFKKVSQLTAEMICHWQRVGFVHGVMNTDNMSILGLTIDYGPYGWQDDYNHQWTPNTTDAQHRRYRFGNQGQIGVWNLLQLANALFPLINDAEPLQELLDSYMPYYNDIHQKMMCQKLGLMNDLLGDKELISSLEKNLHLVETDMTIFFRLLSNVRKDHGVKSSMNLVQDAFYNLGDITIEKRNIWEAWFDKYLERLSIENHGDIDRKISMDKVNPKYVLRNYMAQLAIDKAEQDDFSLIETFYELLQNPYDEQVSLHEWFAKRPDWAKNKVGCSMLSCSS